MWAFLCLIHLLVPFKLCHLKFQGIAQGACICAYSIQYKSWTGFSNVMLVCLYLARDSGGLGAECLVHEVHLRNQVQAALKKTNIKSFVLKFFNAWILKFTCTIRCKLRSRRSHLQGQRRKMMHNRYAGTRAVDVYVCACECDVWVWVYECPLCSISSLRLQHQCKAR